MLSSTCSSLAAALILSALPCGRAGDRAYPAFASATGAPNIVELDEGRRVEWFEKLHGSWPPPKVYPGGKPRQETPEWSRRMDELETDIRNHEDSKTKWDLWQHLAQMRMLANFTPSGWTVAEMDPEVHKEVVSLYEKRDETLDESVGGKLNNNTHLFLVGDRDFWNVNDNLPPALYQRLIEAIQRKLAQWVDLRSEQLSKTSAYGVRVYKRGSILKSHVDHLETHVLSAVYCVAIEGEDEGAEPWYLGAYPDFTGRDAEVDLRPGQLFLYESAKLPHARPGIFHGESYAAMFVHFKPDFWDLTQFEPRFVLPPRFSDPRRGEL